MNPYEVLEKNKANYVPLSPLSFLARAKDVYPESKSVVYGERLYTWKQTYERCVRFASALNKRGIGKNDTVAIIAANTPELVEIHFAVPMAGAVLNTINTRLDAATIRYILEHGDAKVFLVDTQFSSVVKKALEGLEQTLLVIDIDDTQAKEAGERLAELDYESFLAAGDANYDWQLPDDEWQALTLNYTSGTTGQPKGVVYHHRGSYLMTMGTVLAWGLSGHPVYLYTVPLFHCNGWGHIWTMAALAGTIICNRYIDPKTIMQKIAEHKVTHFGGAPIVLSMLANLDSKDIPEIHHKVEAMTAGAPPPSSVLASMEKLGFNVTHVYGLTETYGHVVHCAWHEHWNKLSLEEQADLKARQGVRFPMTEDVRVVDPATFKDVPAGGKAMGEIMIRGNTLMKGYYKNEEATREAFLKGYFHSGDLAVVHPDGYVQVKDRSKDIIISGGENISSVEIENALYKHPSVAVVAVVAKPDETWGETPCAFIELKVDAEEPSHEGLVAFCKKQLASFKTPKTFIFGDLPKTATGKIQKYELRQWARDL